jgi:hypothetical protein
MKWSAAMLLALACGGSKPAAPAPSPTYQCTPGTGTASVLSGLWQTSDSVYSRQASLELHGDATALCGWMTEIDNLSRGDQSGISGTDSRLRLDTVCGLAGPFGWQPSCAKAEIQSTWFCDVALDGGTLSLSGSQCPETNLVFSRTP